MWYAHGVVAITDEVGAGDATTQSSCDIQDTLAPIADKLADLTN